MRNVKQRRQRPKGLCRASFVLYHIGMGGWNVLRMPVCGWEARGSKPRGREACQTTTTKTKRTLVVRRLCCITSDWVVDTSRGCAFAVGWPGAVFQEVGRQFGEEYRTTTNDGQKGLRRALVMLYHIVLDS